MGTVAVSSQRQRRRRARGGRCPLLQPQTPGGARPVLRAIDTKFMGPDVDTRALREKHEDRGPEREISDGVRGGDECAAAGPWRQSHWVLPRVRAPRGGRVALAATFTKADTPDGQRWVFQDVHPGGVAAAAGMRPGDVLLSVARQGVGAAAGHAVRAG